MSQSYRPPQPEDTKRCAGKYNTGIILPWTSMLLLLLSMLLLLSIMEDDQDEFLMRRSEYEYEEVD